MDIEVNNIKIHYEVFGEGKPIILLNPNSVNTNSMNFIAHKLAKDFKVYKFDRRCCGKSERNCELTYEDSAKDVYEFIKKSAKDVYEFIKKLNIDKPYLLGSSGGASVALHVAINYQDCISKLVLCSGVARMEKIKMPKYAKIMNKLPWYPGKKNIVKFENLNNTTKAITQEQLSKITVPTLVLNGGKKDIVPKEEAEYIASSYSKTKDILAI